MSRKDNGNGGHKGYVKRERRGLRITCVQFIYRNSNPEGIICL